MLMCLIISDPVFGNYFLDSDRSYQNYRACCVLSKIFIRIRLYSSLVLSLSVKSKRNIRDISKLRSNQMDLIATLSMLDNTEEDGVADPRSRDLVQKIVQVCLFRICFFGK